MDSKQLEEEEIGIVGPRGGGGPSSRGVGGVTHGDDLDPERRRAGEPARPHSATIVPSVGRLLVLD